MPYGVRGKTKSGNPFVRMQTQCWLQSAEGGPDAGHVQVIGLSTGRRMVSFWIDPADMDHFVPVYFAADDHTRMAFSSLLAAREFADRLNQRERTNATDRRLPTGSVQASLATQAVAQAGNAAEGA